MRARFAFRVSKQCFRGQSLVEATLVLMVFFALLLGVIDCGQVLISHQSLVERVRSAVRWGVVHAWEGPDPVANLVLYDQTAEPRESTAAFLGLKRANVVVIHNPATPDNPDDETLSVAIVGFESHFFSPWIAKTVVSKRPVFISAPMAWRTAGEPLQLEPAGPEAEPAAPEPARSANPQLNPLP
jgi:hypothetical protein